MKKSIPRCLTVAALAAAAFVAPGVAQERTGAIIEELVGEIATGMTELDRKLFTLQSEEQPLQRAVSEAYEVWREAPDAVSKTEARARQLEALAALNAWERRQVDSAIQTLDGVFPTIRELREQVGQLDASGQNIGGKSIVRGETVRSSVSSVANISARLKGRFSDDPEQLANIIEIENKLLLLDEQFADEQRPERGLEVIDTADRSLQSLYVSLKLVARVLETERNRYRVGAVRGTVEAVDERIRSALGSSREFDLGGAVSDRVRNRLRTYEETETQGRRPRVRSGARSPARERRLREIRERRTNEEE